jgi:hypothetical protein
MQHSRAQLAPEASSLTLCAHCNAQQTPRQHQQAMSRAASPEQQHTTQQASGTMTLLCHMLRHPKQFVNLLRPCCLLSPARMLRRVVLPAPASKCGTN